jgi:energy-coupling factor transporter ATP-binding protein EcfA2
MTNSFTDYRNTDIFLIIGSNPAEAHPIAMRHIGKALAKGAKMIVVDPRFTKTASKADLYVPLRPGTDIAFLYGLINYAIENDLYQREYVLNYTNASYLISPDYSFADGIFSGLEEKNGKLTYNNASWAYQKDGDNIRKDPTLQDPRCVWQIMKKHVSRYDIKTVSNVTGTPEDILQKAYAMYCESGKPDVAFGPRNYKLAEEEVEKRVQQALEMVGILHIKDRAPFKLSGGEKRAAAIASVLSMQPDILVMDEPSSALDPKSRRRLINLLNKFEHTKIITSHDLDMVYDLCARTIVIKNGEIAADGPTPEILMNAGLLDACGLEMPLAMQGCPVCDGKIRKLTG